MKKLRVREWQARFAGLRNIQVFSVDMRDSKQYYSGHIALDARFFCHCLAEFNGKSECDSSPTSVDRSPSRLPFRFLSLSAKEPPFCQNKEFIPLPDFYHHGKSEVSKAPDMIRPPGWLSNLGPYPALLAYCPSRPPSEMKLPTAR